MCLHSLSVVSGSLQEAVWFPGNDSVIEGMHSLSVTARSMNHNLRLIGVEVCNECSRSSWNSSNTVFGSTCDNFL